MWASRPLRLAAVLTGLSVDQHFHPLADPRSVRGERELALARLELLEARLGQLGRQLAQAAARRRGSGPLRVLEREAVGEADLVHQRQGLGEVLGVGLGGEADDQVGRERDPGPGRAQPGERLDVAPPVVAAVHGGEYPVRAALHRQVQMRTSASSSP